MEFRNVTSVTLPDTLKSIRQGAFQYTGITEVRIPASVSFIDGSSFSDCNKLETVYFDNDVANTGINISFGSSPFHMCSNIKQFVTPNNKEPGSSVYAEDGVLYLGDMVLQYPAGKEAVSFQVPDFVTSIWQDSFINCKYLQELTIPESVYDISSYAFSDCKALKTVKLSDSIKVIEEGTFAWCESLENITIPDSVTLIKSGAFNNSGLKEITFENPDTTIETGAFGQRCAQIKMKGYDNSTAMRYAEFNRCEFEPILYKEGDQCPVSVDDDIFNYFEVSVNDAACSDVTTVEYGSTLTLKRKSIEDGIDSIFVNDQEVLLQEETLSYNVTAYMNIERPMEVTYVSTVEELEAALNARDTANTKVYLKNNIDVGLWNKIAQFDGILDGQGYSLNNITIIDSHKNGYAEQCAFIDTLNGIIRNTDFINITVGREKCVGSECSSFNAGICCKNNGVIENGEMTGSIYSGVNTGAITLTNYGWIKDFNVDVKLQANQCAGICNDSYGKIKNCQIKGTMEGTNVYGVCWYNSNEIKDITIDVPGVSDVVCNDFGIVENITNNGTAIEPGVTQTPPPVDEPVTILPQQSVTPAETQLPAEFMTPAQTQVPSGEVAKAKLGDVDYNGKVDLQDAQQVLKLALKITLPTEEQKVIADVNFDGKVDLADAQKILRVALKIEDFDKDVPVGSTSPEKSALPGESAVPNASAVPGATLVPGDTSDTPQTTEDSNLEVHKVYSASDLQEMKYYPEETFQLMNDIDLSTIQWESIDEFYGVLDGNGYTISNINKVLINNLKECSVVKNLNMIADIKAEGTACVLSVNACGEIENCIIEGMIQHQNTENGVDDISTFAIMHYGIIEGCTNKAVIQNLGEGRSFTSTGGIVAMNYGTISNSANNGKITASTRDVGGIAGNGYFFCYTRRNGQIINCVNNADIVSCYNGSEGTSYEPCVGGIVGQNKAFIYNCKNTGKVSYEGAMDAIDYGYYINLSHIAGICGTADEYAYVIGCQNTGMVPSGICGEAQIVSGTFDENDKFVVNDGYIIIADCTNSIEGVSEEAVSSYNLCGRASINNGGLLITRCKNSINGSLTNAYVTSEARTEEIMNPTETPVVDSSEAPAPTPTTVGKITIRDNGDVEQLSETAGETYEVVVGDAIAFDITGNELYVSLYPEDPRMCWLENDGVLTITEKGTCKLYAITKEGKVIVHTLVVK